MNWLHYIASHYITLRYITLHYITLHYITLHYFTLHCITYAMNLLIIHNIVQWIVQEGLHLHYTLLICLRFNSSSTHLSSWVISTRVEAGFAAYTLQNYHMSSFHMEWTCVTFHSVNGVISTSLSACWNHWYFASSLALIFADHPPVVQLKIHFLLNKQLLNYISEDRKWLLDLKYE